MSHTLKIESAQNEFFKILKNLDRSAGIKKSEMFFLMGENLIREFLKAPNYEIVSEIATAEMNFLTKAPVKRTLLAPALFKEIDFLGTHHNLLLLKTKTIPVLDQVSEVREKRLDLICPIGDPSNLGALLRNAEAFEVGTVYLTETAANPYHPKCVKASAGSSLRQSFVKLNPNFKNTKSSIGLDMNGVDIASFQWPQHSVLVLGEEGPGLQLPVNLKIKIPTTKVESLNVSVATGIALYCWKNRG